MTTITLPGVNESTVERLSQWLTDHPDRAADLMVDTDDPAFNVWMLLCDALVLRATGVHYLDCTDWRWRDSFDDEVEPIDAVREFLADVL